MKNKQEGSVVMSNFTKSVMYSTTVLAAGLVAIMAIYNSIPSTPEDSMTYANMSPAAGVSASDIGVNFENDAEIKDAAMIDDTPDEKTEAALEQTAEAMKNADTKLDEADYAVNDSITVNITDDVDLKAQTMNAAETAMDIANDIEPAAGTQMSMDAMPTQEITATPEMEETSIQVNIE